MITQRARLMSRRMVTQPSHTLPPECWQLAREPRVVSLCGSPGCDRMASSPGPYPLPGIEMESPMIKLRRHAPAPDLT
eukprot:COSAG01_NODE_675_length_14330_cov_20.977022_10_plen_78_part_00